MLFKGCGTALVTPFTQKNVNFKSLKNLMEMQISNKVDALIVCGTTGENATMTEEEQKQTFEFTVKTVNKRIPVIAGTGSNDTKKAVKMSEFAQSAGADAILCVTPYYNKTTEQGLIAHFKAIAESVDIPIILYNVPARTGLNMLPKTVLKLAEVKNIKGVKEASGNLMQLYEITRDRPADFAVYTGNDEQIIPALMLGADGVISVVSNVVPKYVRDITDDFFKNNILPAQEAFKKLTNLISLMFVETNPVPVKTALNILGFNAGPVRLPLVPMQRKNLALLKKELKKYI